MQPPGHIAIHLSPYLAVVSQHQRHPLQKCIKPLAHQEQPLRRLRTAFTCLCPVQIGEDGGEAVLSSWPTAAGTPEAVIGKVLEYLSAEGLSAGQRKRLAGAAFIPVLNSTRLVPPMRLFTRLRQDLAPFAFEVPPAFAQDIALLKQLGMQDAPTTTDLLGILEVGCRSIWAGVGMQ